MFGRRGFASPRGGPTEAGSHVARHVVQAAFRRAKHPEPNYCMLVTGI